ncbi:MAG: hypothetical protein IT371_30315 [Deltaproteobacteria bacterium]|nr:hypothetical protein [Deltaproteobacteria bacterium]
MAKLDKKDERSLIEKLPQWVQRKIASLEERLAEAEEALGAARKILSKDREGRETEVFLNVDGPGNGIPLPPRSVVRFAFKSLWATKDDGEHLTESPCYLDLMMYDDTIGGPTLRVQSSFDEIMITPMAANLIHVRPSGQFLGRDYVMFHGHTKRGMDRAVRAIKKLTKTGER